MTSTIQDKLNPTPPDQAEALNIFLYAETGVGKTHFIGTAADHEALRPVLIFDTEGGTATLRKKGGIDVVKIKTLEDLVKKINELYMHNNGWYKTFAIDSLTELQDVDMRAVMLEAKQTANNPENVDVDVPSPREWGKSRNHIRKIVRAVRDLEMNTIITALQTEFGEEGKPQKIGPNLPGKLRGEISGFVDIVGYYRKENNGKRILQLDSTIKVPYAKTRFDELGQLIENPTFPMIYEMIHNGKETK